jgi:hypothetical protein
MNYKVFIGFIILIVAINKNDVYAQESKFQAIYMYNFTKYMNWPDQQITIGVMGNSAVLTELNDIARRNPGKLKVIKITGNEGVNTCNMIFLPEDQNENFDLIQNKIGSAAILLIVEDGALIQKGAEIAFYTENGKLKFALNKAALDASKIQVSSSLLAMAKVID